VDIAILDTMCAMADSPSLGRFIRQTRLDKGMSLGQLATAVGRSSSSVRRWERDEVAPALTIMPVLADALDIDVAVLEERRVGQPEEAEVDDEASGPISPGTGSHTIEQPAVVVPAEPPPSPEHSSKLGLFGDMWATVFEDKESWIGWARGITTALILIVMLIVLVWATGELFSALKEVWDSLGAG
jgi:transcriptional regulator with XRE-family HTH domain